ncbi:MAG: bactofilin family protein [Pseudomonadota bacterium]
MSANNRRIRDKYTGTPTVIGTDVLFKGTFSGRAPVIVLGEVEGECQIEERSVTVETGGLWRGRIVADDVVINGKIEGDVEAVGKLELGSKAVVTGNVTAGFVAIAEGAVVDGDIKMTGQRDRPLHFVEKRGGAPVDD